MAAKGRAFDEYWRAFVRAYEAPTTRYFLFMSVSAGIGSAVVGVLARRPLLLLLAPVVAFVPPWLVRRVAGDGPITGVARPVFFAAACVRLWELTLAGQMEAEVARVRETPAGSEEEADEDPPFPRPNMVTDHTLH
jgi:hypothetical protein